jgi:uncharacterized metal-binding protein
MLKLILLMKKAIYSDTGVAFFIERVKTGLIEVLIWQKLLKHHFDVFGLIEKGFAIDINTLSTQNDG